MRRRLLIAAIFLLAGVVANFLVAGYCALYVVGAELYNLTPRLNPAEKATTADMRWLDARAWKLERDDYAVSWAQFTAPGLTRREYFLMQRMYFERRSGGGIGGGFISFAIRTTSGLPLRSFQAEEWLDQERLDTEGDLVYECSGGVPVAVGVDIGGPIDMLRPLPCRPLLLGFSINTLFYAVVLWLLISGPFALRRFIRVRRGLCPACAYPMAESSVCTECGKPLPKRARAAT